MPGKKTTTTLLAKRRVLHEPCQVVEPWGFPLQEGLPLLMVPSSMLRLRVGRSLSLSANFPRMAEETVQQEEAAEE